MFKQMTLQNRLTGAFLFMGSIVLAVAYVGWSGNIRLSHHIDILSKSNLPSLNGLWKIDQGQTQIQSSDRALVNPRLSQANRQIELNRIQDAWEQIDEGFKEYESAPQVDGEAAQYKKFLEAWKLWKQDHEEFLRIYEAAKLDNISSKEFDLLSSFIVDKERRSFDAATKEFLGVLEINENLASNVQKTSIHDVNNTSFLVLLGMTLGPAIAVTFGIYFSRTIAKPLGAKISEIVNAVVSSSTEIAATIEQQERAAMQQASSVNQTTTTMDELGSSSKQSAEQAQASATGAQQVLLLVDGRGHDGQSNESSLREKVGDIANQILHLSEQTNQIGMISALVSDLATQTNLLALNAAVEAVRAGEHGKGFAVVASEIRKLADQSKTSAEKINGLVADIQKSTNSTVMVTHEGTKTVEEIVDAMRTIALNGQQIALTSNQQAVAVRQVVEAMNSLNITARETAAGISQIKVGTQKLNDAATKLQTVV
jgi:methyl-accepting chemotaxis protein